MLSITVFASMAEAVYVQGDKVNMRSGPSTSSQVIGRVMAGEIGTLTDRKEGWVQMETCVGPDCQTGWVSSQFVTVLNEEVVPEDALLRGFIYDDGDNFGMLQFKKVGKDQWGNILLEYSFWIKNFELAEAGGTGIVVCESGTVPYTGAFLQQPENYIDGYSTVYDSRQGLMYYAGILWDENK